MFLPITTLPSILTFFSRTTERPNLIVPVRVVEGERTHLPERRRVSGVRREEVREM